MKGFEFIVDENKYKDAIIFLKETKEIDLTNEEHMKYWKLNQELEQEKEKAKIQWIKENCETLIDAQGKEIEHIFIDDIKINDGELKEFIELLYS